ncbi:MAG: peptide chain release factor N(5)-glutamine methyltransferase [Ignavibacteriota bacterium]|jgi:release factor glutamine methyltransferase|nr:peptide chain release factor N(5)-glutamine methyltransferase [Ignavibacteriales bacterium]MBL1121635.1 peptide chain release factor N(5)-glutamine methyltransferase [Ignavibacteriota bacterium]MCC7092732.1 peptide chain release factor N(5)-glutamine methyltransferase [Ignavibacteriaceae bacterium]MCE7856704.1 peptide chain release factor N(5)-glutamine methyltransferase [Ignavibacteria bacterium CHB3]MEB2296632.1 peptide chain release factor N(5)-glutamine methyltransferase [Ignavibacteria 
MITVLEAIRLSTEYLDKKKIDSPRINAELLLAHIIGCKRLDLYLAFDRPLTEPELNIYRGLIKRRASYEPLQYIIGTVEFYGLVFKVTPSVLIPRPETELLVEKIIKELSDKEQLNILEIGCGSGNIAISLAYHLKQAQIITTDISDAALNLAKENSQKLGVAERISFIRHNILTDDLLRFSMFDLVVSNPPYVSLQSYSSLQKEIMDFEPRLAVTDESDGLTFYRIISEKVSGNIKKGGKLFFEISHGQCDDVKSIMTKNNFSKIEVIKDYQNIERIVFGEFK